MKTTTLLALAVGMIAAGSANGDDDQLITDVAEIIFTGADANEDGVMTRSEHDEAGLGRWGRAYADLDLNGDGLVSKTEYRIFFEMVHRPGRPS